MVVLVVDVVGEGPQQVQLDLFGRGGQRQPGVVVGEERLVIF